MGTTTLGSQYAGKSKNHSPPTANDKNQLLTGQTPLPSNQIHATNYRQRVKSGIDRINP